MHLPLAHLNDVMKAAEVSGTVLVTALTYIYRMKARHHQWEDAHLDTAAATSQTQGYDAFATSSSSYGFTRLCLI